MLSRPQHFVLCMLGVLAIAMVVVNAWLLGTNRSAQAEIHQRQQFLQQTVQLEVLYRDIAKALADLALKNNDRQLLEMLSSQGLNVTLNPAPAVPPASGTAGTLAPSPTVKR